MFCPRANCGCRGFRKLWPASHGGCLIRRIVALLTNRSRKQRVASGRLGVGAGPAAGVSHCGGPGCPVWGWRSGNLKETKTFEGLPHFYGCSTVSFKTCQKGVHNVAQHPNLCHLCMVPAHWFPPTQKAFFVDSGGWSCGSLESFAVSPGP